MSGNRKSIRLKDYDYTQQGAYFVTICGNNRKCVFGDVKNGKMVLNDAGKMVVDNWNKIPKRFANIEMDEYRIMPNHMHGIITIAWSYPCVCFGNSDVGAGFPRPNDDKGRGDRAPTLGQIVAYFKYGTTKQINAIRNTPGTRLWQRNFYEHVIRGESDLNRIREYIINNPAGWEKDEYYSS